MEYLKRFMLLALVSLTQFAWPQGRDAGPAKMSFANRIWLYSDYGQDFVITDPKGRRVGKNSKTGESFKEIPNASYEMEAAIGDLDLSDGSDDTGPPQMYFQYLERLPAGSYKVDIHGKPGSKFSVRVLECDRSGAPFRASEKKGALPTNGAYSFKFDLSSEPPAPKR